MCLHVYMISISSPFQIKFMTSFSIVITVIIYYTIAYTHNLLNQFSVVCMYMYSKLITWDWII